MEPITGIPGYIVYHFQEIKRKDGTVGLTLKSKIITAELKESYIEFLKTIDNRTPSEKEFNEWESKNKK